MMMAEQFFGRTVALFNPAVSYAPWDAQVRAIGYKARVLESYPSLRQFGDTMVGIANPRTFAKSGLGPVSPKLIAVKKVLWPSMPMSTPVARQRLHSCEFGCELGFGVGSIGWLARSLLDDI